MISIQKLICSLKELGLTFFTGVPDSLLNDFCVALESSCCINDIMTANEGNAIGVAAGFFLSTGKIPVVYMQNSGIGNAMNPLLSLTHRNIYSIPMILVVGWRGEPDIKDHVQHKKQGELTTVLMCDMDIPYSILDSDETIVEKFIWAQNKAKEISSPVALIVKKGILSRKDKQQIYPESTLMYREEAIEAVLDTLGDEAIYLGTTGRATRELHEQIKVHGISHGKEFLNVGAMGHLSSIGLGIAIGAPDKKIVVFDGDASAIMHMGSFATIGRYHPSNIIHIVLNNGVNESVGGQLSPGRMIDLSKVAQACGYKTNNCAITDRESLVYVVKELSKMEGPCFIDVHIRQGIRKDLPMLSINHKQLKEELLEATISL